MNNLLSLVTFLPLIGAVVLVAVPARRGRDGAAQRQAARPLHHQRHLRALALHPDRLRPLEPRLPVRRGERLARRAHLQDGRRRHLGPVRAADHPADADHHRRQLERHHPDQGIHRRLPGPRDADARRLLRPRPRALLHLLRGRPDPDVPHHRRLGRRATGSTPRSSSSSTPSSARSSCWSPWSPCTCRPAPPTSRPS